MHTWPRPLPSSVSSRWCLDPEVAFLNHGSFGACPEPLLAHQHELRRRIERQPVKFFARELAGLMDEARHTLARFVNADPEGVAWVNNATSGVNTVLRSLHFEPGDELLTTSHDYHACRNALRFVAERSGAKVVVAEVPWPLRSPAEVVDAVLALVAPRTKLALIDHVTSSTGLVFPVHDIVQALRARGVDTLVDGAHALGMLELDLTALGATYYTGNAHKWMCAPKGAALLYVSPERRDVIRPLTISHGASLPRPGVSRFRQELDWAGTDDPTPWLCAAKAVELVPEGIEGGWQALRAHNRAMVLAGRAHLLEILGAAEPPAPESMIGSLASMTLPDGAPDPATPSGFSDAWQRELWERHRIEVPVFTWPAAPRRLLRISAQAYNRPEHYERLGEALKPLL